MFGLLQEHKSGLSPKSGNWHGNELVYIDTLYSIIFPIMYALFNLIYWPYRYDLQTVHLSVSFLNSVMLGLKGDCSEF